MQYKASLDDTGFLKILRNPVFVNPCAFSSTLKPCKFICVVDRLGDSRRGGNNQGLIDHLKGKIVSLCAKIFVVISNY